MLPTTMVYSGAELAKEAGITYRAVRLYVEKGLMTCTKVGQFSVFTQNDLTRLRSIVELGNLGFTLREIAEIFPSGNDFDVHNLSRDTIEKQIEFNKTQMEILRKRIKTLKAIARLRGQPV